MGNIRPSNIKSIATSMVESNPGSFSQDFHKNKELVKSRITGVSKKTLNAISGYITRYVIKKDTKLKKEMETYSAE
ncbi:MAG: 30S ribosomal protein S17e [Candidatus Thermoplasmatota archaeon]|jgi:small subunit ribosomal protein S17e|nr:30S ribosomal protein S17e [Candidatus Thermoplasmatota archaeon]MCL5793502.1 30S ribosomal protein S17e [Candidatus Thermoplasmatota archaeon]